MRVDGTLCRSSLGDVAAAGGGRWAAGGGRWAAGTLGRPASTAQLALLPFSPAISLLQLISEAIRVIPDFPKASPECGGGLVR